MDLQVKLANDGYAQEYKSPEAAHLPSWAVWKDQAYGTTFEPIAFVYNKRLVKPEEVPKTHADFGKELKAHPDRWKGKLTATFLFGVLRVVAFIGVGVLSALIVLALKHHAPWHGLAIALARSPVSSSLRLIRSRLICFRLSRC